MPGPLESSSNTRPRKPLPKLIKYPLIGIGIILIGGLISDLLPRNEERIYQRAKDYFWDKEFSLALSSIDEAIEMNGENSDYFSLRSKIHDRLGDSVASANDYQSALNYSVSDSARFELIDVHMSHYYYWENFDKQRELLESALEIDTQDPELYYGIEHDLLECPNDAMVFGYYFFVVLNLVLQLSYIINDDAEVLVFFT